jgi:hypothetical protein
MARSLTVKHEESPSPLFALLLLVCGALLLLAAAVGTAPDGPARDIPVEQATLH